MSRIIVCDKCGKEADATLNHDISCIELARHGVRLDICADLCEGCLDDLKRWMKESYPRPA
jgi:hypothetical protein